MPELTVDAVVAFREQPIRSTPTSGQYVEGLIWSGLFARLP
jgi:hypothetical protein